MQIDPVYFLQPLAVFAISLAAIVWWWARRGFRGAVLGLSLAAYFLAIALKEVVQLLTLSPVEAAFGYASVETGLYLGLQTVFFEVGLAYLFARYGVRRRGLGTQDAVAYGLGLSFWENGVLLGLVSLFDLAVVYLVLTTNGALAATVAAALPASYFASPQAALGTVAIGTLERVSSMLAHVAWGILTVAAAATGRRRLLAAALPMGLVDALVPFAGYDVDLFEGVVFILSVVFVVVALRLTRGMLTGPTSLASSPTTAEAHLAQMPK